jgi:hypothetical protein
MSSYNKSARRGYSPVAVLGESGNEDDLTSYIYTSADGESYNKYYIQPKERSLFPRCYPVRDNVISCHVRGMMILNQPTESLARNKLPPLPKQPK